jgi:NAD(P)-dependent dehydrogenase (short-subunit alcohol dehydrogenase family)
MPAAAGDVRDAVAVVIGSTRGIGLKTAQYLAGAGARVVLNDRSGVDSDDAVRTVRAERDGGDVSYVRANIAARDEVNALVESVMKRHGRIDIWVNNGSPGAHIDFFERTQPTDWQQTVDAKLITTMNGIRAAIPALRASGGGSIVNVVSDAGRVGTSGESLVAAAYGGVVALTKSLARELARDAIRVNCVSISLTRDTDGYERLASDEMRRRVFERVEQRMRLGVLEPADVAHAVLFFAGSRRVTGQTLSVNSGLSFPS